MHFVLSSLIAALVAGPTVTVNNTASDPVPVTAAAPLPVSGSVAVSNGAANPVPVTASAPLPISGSVTVSNASVPIAGTVAVSNLQSDSNGNVKVAQQNGRLALFDSPGHVLTSGEAFVTLYEDVSDCRSMMAFVQSNSGAAFQVDLLISYANNGFGPNGTVHGTQLGDGLVYAFTINGTAAVGPFAALRLTSGGFNAVYTVLMYCGR